VLSAGRRDRARADGPAVPPLNLGKVGVNQLGREAVLGERGVTLCDSSTPCGLEALGTETAIVVRADVPRVMVALTAPRIDEAVATRVSGQGGVGALFAQFLTDVTATDAWQFRRACHDAGPPGVSRLASLP
jgi:hypothetical protein